MAIKPILFSGDMVNAILAGRKTQTRRRIKPQAVEHSHANGFWSEKKLSMAPYQVRDTLYVRETWRQSPEGAYFYRADMDDNESKWKPSIHMPKRAARLFLEVTSVRAERLRDITEKDAISEGCGTNEEYSYLADSLELPCPDCGGCEAHIGVINGGATEVNCSTCDSSKKRFRLLWDYLNEKRGCGWCKNPWVWVYTFKRVEKSEGWHDV